MSNPDLTKEQALFNQLGGRLTTDEIRRILDDRAQAAIQSVPSDRPQSAPSQTMKKALDELAHAFAHHPPKNNQTEEMHAHIRDVLYGSARAVRIYCPPGRETALALTKLEEAMFWANAAIARNPT